jgi:hypothetical protein
MRRFEYYSIQVGYTERDAVMNKLGFIGWELVAVTLSDVGPYERLYFKREVK